MRGLLLSSLARGLLLLRELTVQSLLDDSRTDLEVVHPPLVEDVERLELHDLRKSRYMYKSIKRTGQASVPLG